MPPFMLDHEGVSRMAERVRERNYSRNLLQSKANTPRRNQHQRSYATADKVRRLFLTCGVFLIILELLVLRLSFRFFNDDSSGEESSDPSSADKNEYVKRIPDGPPDGTFHGYPVYYQNVTAISYTKPYTLQHCQGENYQEQNGWMHRSCHFKFMCFNLTNRRYQVYQRKGDADMLPYIHERPLVDFSDTFLLQDDGATVSLGGINLKWQQKGFQRLKWFPDVHDTPPTEFYSLPESVVLIPFHSFAGWNPGHGVWDDLLPIFTLMQIFQFDTDLFDILAIRHILEDGDPLWASCDTPEKAKDCHNMQTKFWPLLNNRSSPISQRDVQLQLSSKGTAPKTDLVCAKNGLAGIGALTDHGIHKLHGWLEEDYKTTHNHGRGQLLWNFRLFTLQNAGIQDASSQIRSSQKPPYQIVFSVQSSTNPARNLDFSIHESLLQIMIKPHEAVIKSVVLKDLTLKEQMKLATETTIFITGCGGGAVTATWLPRGATLIVYYNEKGGRKANVETNLPARLDWDLFNKLSYLRVHWFPSGTMMLRPDTNQLFEVIRADLNRRNFASEEDQG